MKTGFDVLDTHSFDESQLDFLRKVVAIMKILSKEALQTAKRFTECCGRTVVTGNDVYYALMYEAHEFFDKDFDSEFMQELENERTHTYETDDEEDEGEEDEGEEDEGEENNEEELPVEAYTIDCVVVSEKEFHDSVIKYAKEWRNWLPDDPVKALLKNAVDKTQEKVG